MMPPEREVFALKAPRWLGEVGWRTIAGAALLGGIIHICATLVVPVVGSSVAFARLSEVLPANRMVVLAPPSPGKEPLPFLPPDSLYALCRFDLSVDSLRVNVLLAHLGWALSMHTPQGDNFYVMPAQPEEHSEVSLTLGPGGDKLEFNPSPGRLGADSIIAAPSNEGLIIVRAPLKGLAWRAESEAVLRRASCSPVKR
jgi:uncharacterized membrane protein